MSRIAQLLVGGITDFIITAGTGMAGYMVAKEGVVMPSAAMILLACILGAIAAAKQIRGMTLDLKPLVVLLALSMAFTGCAYLPPMYIKCSGKGAITGTASLGGGLLYGGGGTNTGNLQADCGESFEYYRGPKPKDMPGEGPAAKP